MFIGVLQIEFFMNMCGALKFKKQIIRCIKDKIRANFNVSVSEIKYQDKWQRAMLAVACVVRDKKYLNGMLNKISDMIRNEYKIEVIDLQMEIY